MFKGPAVQNRTTITQYHTSEDFKAHSNATTNQASYYGAWRLFLRNDTGYMYIALLMFRQYFLSPYSSRSGNRLALKFLKVIHIYLV